MISKPSWLGVALVGGMAVSLGAAPAAWARPVAARHFHPVISVSAHGTSLHASRSSNWSGYNEGLLSTKTPFSSISGSWIVPKATQHTKGQAEDSATWIGIGGGCLNTSCQATDETLIQAGTEQDVSSTGKASYSAWWEVIPAPSISASIPVEPGNKIVCTIRQSKPEVWVITLKDVSNGKGFTKTVPYASDESTAEWIEETPVVVGTSGSGLAALPNLGVVKFSKAEVNGRSARLVPADEVQLTNSNGVVIAAPSAPYKMTAFDDCTWAKRCATP
jgi:hypothetical protein